MKLSKRAALNVDTMELINSGVEQLLKIMK